MNHLIILSMADAAEKIRAIVDEALGLITGNGFTDLLIQLGATLILFLAVRFLLWNKITAVLEKRKADYDKAVKEKEDAILETAKAKEEADKVVNEAKKEGATIIEVAKERSYKEAEKIIDDAKDEAKSIIVKANEEIESDKAKAEDNIKQEIIDVAFLMASKITEKEISPNNHAKLVDDFMKEVKKND